jgi:elongation factor 1-beta
MQRMWFSRAVISMGEVIVGLKVMPESPETDMKKLKNDIKNAIPDGVTLRGLNEKYIAFGLKAVDVTVTMPDSAGGSESVEKALSKIPNVGSVEVTGTGLL